MIPCDLLDASVNTITVAVSDITLEPLSLKPMETLAYYQYRLL